MCEKICSEDGRAFIYLSHQNLINEAYKTSENTNYELRTQIFDFRAKDERANETQTRKRKGQKQAPENVLENVNDDDILQAYDSIKAKLPIYHCTNLNPQKSDDESLSMTPTRDCSRFWEELQSADFPKFKGANGTKNFQTIDNLVKGKKFLIPPSTLFYNYDIADLKKHIPELNKFDLIVLDPPWRNKYIRRLKKFNLGYNMLENVHLKELPIRELIHKNSLIAIWCTNSKQHQDALIDDFLPTWQLRLLHTVKWLKLNTYGQLITTPTKNLAKKQPYEHLFVACHKDAEADFGLQLKEIDFILSVPSIIHSHKPPLLAWFRSYFVELQEPKCLELFARYLQPNFTSYGLEVIKLMDSRLYKEVTSSNTLESS